MHPPGHSPAGTGLVGLGRDSTHRQQNIRWPIVPGDRVAGAVLFGHAPLPQRRL